MDQGESEDNSTRHMLETRKSNFAGAATRSMTAASPAEGKQNAAWEILSRISQPVALGRGKTLVRAGEQAMGYWVVRSGVLKSLQSRGRAGLQINAMLSVGDIVGVGVAHTHPSDVVAATSCVLLYALRSQVETAARESPGLASLLAEAITHQMSRANDQLRHMQGPARARIANLLLTLAREGLGPKSREDLIWWPLTVADMANYLSLAPETASRTLHWLQAGNFIGPRAKGFIRLLDRQGLEALSKHESWPNRELASFNPPQPQAALG